MKNQSAKSADLAASSSSEQTTPPAQSSRALVRPRRSQRLVARRRRQIVHRDQQRAALDVMRETYRTAPQSVWQSATARSVELNGLLLAAVLGEQDHTSLSLSQSGTGHLLERDAVFGLGCDSVELWPKHESSSDDEDFVHEHASEEQSNEDHDSENDTDM